MKIIATIAIALYAAAAGAQPSASKVHTSASSNTLVDLNSASAAELNKVPGIGAATAKKIIAGRPYNSVADLSKAGLPTRQIQQISPLVTVKNSSSVGSGPATVATPTGPRMTPSAPMTPSLTSPKVPRSMPPAVAGNPVPYTAPPSPGMVWVNLETKVFHREGDRWYGRTRRGTYMAEPAAIQAGYRASKDK